jgi:prostatic aicd phosphatase
MSFELRQPFNSSNFENLFVRFGFRNGSDAGAELEMFAMFGRREIEADILWTQFLSAMVNQSITSQKDWCHTCVLSNLTFCAAYTTSNSGPAWGDTIDASVSCSRISSVTAGFIGVGVTFAAILGIETIVALIWNRRR